MIINNPLFNIVHIKNKLSNEECNSLIEIAEKSNKWTTKRHSYYPTHDVPVSDLPEAQSITEKLLNSIPSDLVNGYSLNNPKVSYQDLFIVKYSLDGQSHLNMHRDVSILSFVLQLNPNTDFDEGGTYYKHHNKTIRADIGDIVYHCGKIHHSGVKITRGVRYILAGFLRVLDDNLVDIPNNTETKDIFNKSSDEEVLRCYWKHNFLSVNFERLGMGNCMFKLASAIGISKKRNISVYLGEVPKKLHGFNVDLFPSLKPNVTIKEKYIGEKYEGVYDERMISSYTDDMYNIRVGRYLQNTKYFDNCKQEIYDIFKPNEKYRKQSNEWFTKHNLTNCENIVAIHFRRTDMLEEEQNLPSLNWVNQILSILPSQNLHILIFSDDLDWVNKQEIFKKDNCHIVVTNDHMLDFTIMLNCHYYILTRGTFAWWAAYLSKTKRKVFYQNEFKDTKLENNFSVDFYPSDWLELKGERLNVNVDLHIKIINLDYRFEKYQKLLENIAILEIPTGFTLSVSRVNADKGSKGNIYKNWVLSQEDLNRYKSKYPNLDNLDTLFKYWKTPIRPGELGCWNSHMETIQTQPESIEYLLMLEDDASLPNNFLYKVKRSLIECNQDFDLIDFGGIEMYSNNNNRHYSKYLNFSSYNYQTHCILYSKAGINKIKKIDRFNNIIPFDEFISCLTHSHIRTDINTLYCNENFLVLTPKQRFVFQNSNGIHDTYNNSKSFNMSIEKYKKLEYDYENNKKFLKDNCDDCDNYWYIKQKFTQEIITNDLSTIIYDKIISLIKVANELTWNFNINAITKIQHITVNELHNPLKDWFTNCYHNKKLMFILNKKKSDDVIGGEFLIKTNNEDRKLPSDTNILIVFPSFIMSKISPILKGNREYLVGWILGPNFN